MELKLSDEQYRKISQAAEQGFSGYTGGIAASMVESGRAAVDA